MEELEVSMVWGAEAGVVVARVAVVERAGEARAVPEAAEVVEGGWVAEGGGKAREAGEAGAGADQAEGGVEVVEVVVWEVVEGRLAGRAERAAG